MWVISCLSSAANAATYHVDWDDGNDSTGNGSAGNPWKTPWFGDDQLSSGDTLIIHEKDDGSPYNNGTSPVIESITSNVTIQAATGEGPKISITSTFGDTTWPGGGLWVIQIGIADVTLDGFTIWGQVHVNTSGSGAQIINNDISGGVGGRDNFPSVIYLHGTNSSTRLTNVLVQNNILHSNVSTTPETAQNSPLIMMYYAGDITFSNNEFHSGRDAAAWAKVGNAVLTFNNNYVHDTPGGFSAASSVSTDTNLVINNNIFVTVGALSAVPLSNGLPDANYLRFYNNTLYNSTGIYWWAIGSDPDQDYLEYFNNINYVDSDDRYFSLPTSNRASGDEANWFVYLNENNYYATGATGTFWYDNAAKATTLANWQSYLSGEGATSGNDETGSVATDPGFVNASGLFNTPTDFKRSSYTANGRGGSWPSVMGAYVTGNETIGVTSSAGTGVPGPSRAYKSKGFSGGFIQ